MTSPPAIDPRASHVVGLIEFLMNRTEPSQNETLTPPGWKLRAAVWAQVWRPREFPLTVVRLRFKQSRYWLLGVSVWLKNAVDGVYHS